MRVRFWGVRGSIAVSGPKYGETGGNTACVALESGGERLIIDSGTGLRGLGEELGFAPTRATLLFSHLHWDHIQGFPFFTPAYHPGSELTLLGLDGDALHGALDDQMRPPNFPITLDAMPSTLRFDSLRMGEPLDVGPFRITAASMDHPDGVIAYRVEADGRAVVYATDVEHGDTIDRRTVEISEGADLLIHDAQYTREEYETMHRGWGHSCWDDAVGVARMAGVERLALFHHDPKRRDEQVSWIEQKARGQFSGVFAAREGYQLTL